MKTKNTTLSHQTKGLFDFIDVTSEVKKFVSESSVKNGLVNIQIMHTSAALIFNENEPLLLEDIKNNLEEQASKSISYQHDNFDKRTVNVCENECVNGHSHCKAIRLPSTVTLNLIDGKLQLGQWQSIILAELDSPRPRKIQVQVIGE